MVWVILPGLPVMLREFFWPMELMSTLRTTTEARRCMGRLLVAESEAGQQESDCHDPIRSLPAWESRRREDQRRRRHR